MVKEVEFSNFLELINDGSTIYSDGNNQVMFDGILTNDAINLTITVGKEIPTSSQGCRQLTLYYGSVDFESRFVDYSKLSETILDTASPNTYNKSYDFDLSRVLIIPQKVYSTGGSTDLVIQLYTYEANLTTAYGDKRISVPYSVNSNTQYEYSQSTDGLYRLYMTDYAVWSAVKTYFKGDIITSNGSLYMSLEDNNVGDSPGHSAKWAVPTDQNKVEFSYGSSVNGPMASIIADILISRYAKYEYILKALTATGFKTSDNDKAKGMASIMQMFRERALLQLLDNKPLDAMHSLQQLKLASSAVNSRTEVRTFNVKYTV